MPVQYAKTYIDRAFANKDLSTLYDVIRVLAQERNFSERFSLLLRVLEWIGSTRSGVWQYYENIPIEDFNQIAAMMDRNGLTEIAARYRAGMERWEEPRYCDDLDAWIETNELMLEETALRLIEPHRESLYPTS